MITTTMYNNFKVFHIYQHIERDSDVLSFLHSEIQDCLDKNQLLIALSIHNDSYLYSEVIAKIVNYHGHKA